MRGSYQEIYARSLRDPDGFWAEAAEALVWDRRWDRVLDDARPPFYRWFAGGRLNTCYKAVDRHVEAGRGSQAALIHDSPVTDSIRTVSFPKLQDQVARFAGAHRQQGVGYGDRWGARASAPCIPWCSAALRRTSWRHGSTTPSRSSWSRPPAASRRAA